MAKKDTMVTCPCCESRLEVDSLSGKVIRWRRAEELDETGKPVLREEDWEAAASRVESRLGAAGGKFEESLQREKSREQDLDDLFKKASEKVKRRPAED